MQRLGQRRQDPNGDANEGPATGGFNQQTDFLPRRREDCREPLRGIAVRVYAATDSGLFYDAFRLIGPVRRRAQRPRCLRQGVQPPTAVVAAPPPSLNRSAPTVDLWAPVGGLFSLQTGPLNPNATENDDHGAVRERAISGAGGDSAAPGVPPPDDSLPDHACPCGRPAVAQGLVVSWCGMRGLVAPATALALPESFPAYCVECADRRTRHTGSAEADARPARRPWTDRRELFLSGRGAVYALPRLAAPDSASHMAGSRKPRADLVSDKRPHMPIGDIGNAAA
jgi:hypothetical protein